MAGNGPQVEKGYTRIAHELLEPLAAQRIPGRVKDIFLYVLRGTYGMPGSPKSADFVVNDIAEKLGVADTHARKALRRLAAARMVTIEQVRRKTSGKLVRGVWRIAPQKMHTEWLPWSVVMAAEREARGPVEQQRSLFDADTRGPLNGHARSAQRTRAVCSTDTSGPDRSHKPLQVNDVCPPKTEDRKTERPIPDARAGAGPAVDRPGGSRNNSGSDRALPTTTTSPRERPFDGLYESDQLRAGAEGRLRASLRPDLEDLVGEAAAAIEREARRGRKPPAIANKILGDRARVRRLANELHADRCAAIAASQGPPKDDGPRGGAPRVAGSCTSGGAHAGSPAAAVTILEKGANGCVREAVALGGRMDPFAFLASVGVEIGARLGAAPAERALESAGRAA